MNKYNIRVIIPILNKSYELFVPNNILVGNLLYMLINSLNEINGVDLKNMLLYDSYNGEELNLEEFVYNVINNGTLLVLA